jgi:hypothetical protein
MNKDRKVAEFEKEKNAILSDNVKFKVNKTYSNLPIGFSDINSWIDSRKASKHNAHLRNIMQHMGCNDNEGFIRMTHAASINDTFWIKSEKEDVKWADISLYRNEFTQTISRLAFEGVGLYEELFSSSSPELACEGSFRKCFRKEKYNGEYGSDIFIYKRGGDIGNGIEPYCESMASEIAKIVSPSSVSYDVVKLHGKDASRCNLFTDEKYGYASFARTDAYKKNLNVDDIFEYFSEIGCEQNFREMLVIDALCFNQDRHSGNFGIIFNNDTMEIVKMAPVFDLNISLFPYVHMDEFDKIGDKLFDYCPKLGDDFTRIGQMGMNDVIRERVKDLKDFHFSFRGNEQFPLQRVEIIEKIVNIQAEAILSPDKLYTKDVFVSDKAKQSEQNSFVSENAQKIMEEFDKEFCGKYSDDMVLVSTCASVDTVQMYIEDSVYSITIDFIKKEISITENMQEITEEKLKERKPELYDVYEDILSSGIIQDLMIDKLKEKEHRKWI